MHQEKSAIGMGISGVLLPYGYFPNGSAEQRIGRHRLLARNRIKAWYVFSCRIGLSDAQFS